MRRALILLAWPLIEIGLFVMIGGAIGLWATLGWVLATAVAGVLLLKFTAARGMMLLRGGMTPGALQDGAPLAGLLRGLAAVMLILPGFLTDAIGVLLLVLQAIPAFRRALGAAVMGRMVMPGMGAAMGGTMGGGGMGFGGPRGATPPRGGDAGDVVEGEWVEVPTEANRNRPSRWTEIE